MNQPYLEEGVSDNF